MIAQPGQRPLRNNFGSRPLFCAEEMVLDLQYEYLPTTRVVPASALEVIQYETSTVCLTGPKAPGSKQWSGNSLLYIVALPGTLQAILIKQSNLPTP